MEDFTLSQHAHRRYNILTGEWVLVSPHRDQRPWQGQIEKISPDQRPAYDPTCYLCPGNTRAGGVQNPSYDSTFVFVNDFGALLPDTTEGDYSQGLLHAESEQGICRVICFSPRHDLTLAGLNPSEMRAVIELWIEQYRELGAMDFINHVQIFENKGEIMGCSNPHPHGQVWAQRTIPNVVMQKQRSQLSYWKEMRSGLLQDYLAQELKAGDRIVFENENFVVIVPFWAIWPFEAMIAPKRIMANIAAMKESEKQDFAEALSKLTRAYDQVFEVSFPYSAGIHQAPTDGKLHPEWHWHMSFYPPLLRSATVKKFMVGYEMFGQPQRDFTPEKAAQILKSKVA